MIHVNLTDSSTLPKLAYANNSANMAYVGTVTVSSNVTGRTLEIAYVGGSTITTITTVSGVKKYDIIATIVASNAGLDIQADITDSGGLAPGEAVNVNLEVELFNLP